MTLAGRRARYAARLTDDPALRAAFAAVPREAFLGLPPWTLLAGGAPARETDDPAALYADVLVALDRAQGLNNGSPSLHAHMLALLDARPGHRALHVGAGGGYYSAILAELGATVQAVEADAALAGAAAPNLRPWPTAHLIHGDGAGQPAAEVDRIYVNAAIADLPPRWLDHLAPGGILLAPLGAPDPDAPDIRHTARAALLKITRRADGFAAQFDRPVAFVCADGPAGGDAATRAALWRAMAGGGRERVTALRRRPTPGAWFNAPGWSLVGD